MARYDRYNTPSIFRSLSAQNFVGDIAFITNVYLTSVEKLEVLNSPILGESIVIDDFTHTDILTAREVIVSQTIYASGGNSDEWNASYALVTSVSGFFDNLEPVIPTVTNFLSTTPITLSSIDVVGTLLSAGIDLHDIFLKQDFDNQTLSFDSDTLNLSILSGNTVNLSGVNTTFTQNSAKYEEVVSLVAQNSASWEESDLILPTVTNYLSTNVVNISALTVPVVQITDASLFTNIIFTGADSGKLVHLNTSVNPEITINFPADLPEGFNVGVVNTGTGVININSDYTPIINARGLFNSVQHTGMFIYKTNNQLYGIGIFE